MQSSCNSVLVMEFGEVANYKPGRELASFAGAELMGLIVSRFSEELTEEGEELLLLLLELLELLSSASSLAILFTIPAAPPALL